MLSRKNIAWIALGLMLVHGVHAYERLEDERINTTAALELPINLKEERQLLREDLTKYFAWSESEDTWKFKIAEHDAEYVSLSSPARKTLKEALLCGQNNVLFLLNQSAVEGNNEAKKFIINLLWDNADTIRGINWFQGAVSAMSSLKSQPTDWQETVKKINLNFGLDETAIIDRFSLNDPCVSYTLILDNPVLLYDICVDYLYQKSQSPKKSKLKSLFKKISPSEAPQFKRKETEFYKFWQLIKSVNEIESSLLVGSILKQEFDMQVYLSHYGQTHGRVKNFLRAIRAIKR
jgi:hypothetical protein